MTKAIIGMIQMRNGQSLISVEAAIKLLRPRAKFELVNKIFTKWDHEDDPPSWDEIDNMMKLIEQFVNDNELPDTIIVE
jgi:hypothetical protein